MMMMMMMMMMMNVDALQYFFSHQQGVRWNFLRELKIFVAANS